MSKKVSGKFFCRIDDNLKMQIFRQNDLLGKTRVETDYFFGQLDLDFLLKSYFTNAVNDEDYDRIKSIYKLLNRWVKISKMTADQIGIDLPSPD